mmetsp:Transcript_46655/g.113446  ORF Transcript_46655/g.113446 Transcript_46655/m.113446 type:complete len:155 (-) Transcript_46655:1057-1521(-)
MTASVIPMKLDSLLACKDNSGDTECRRGLTDPCLPGWGERMAEEMLERRETRMGEVEWGLPCSGAPGGEAAADRLIGECLEEDSDPPKDAREARWEKEKGWGVCAACPLACAANDWGCADTAWPGGEPGGGEVGRGRRPPLGGRPTPSSGGSLS